MAKTTNLFDKMRKNIRKKNEDAIIDLTEPKIWASSGNYVLNHILSGRFSRGYPAGRVTQIFGDSGCLIPNEKIKIYKFRIKCLTKNDFSLSDRMMLDELPQNLKNSLIDNKNLKKIFLEYAESNSYFDTIEQIYNSWNYNFDNFMVDTPDGLQLVTKFIKKDIRPCYKLQTKNHSINCSGDHLIETDNNWLKTEEIKVNDNVLTISGFEPVLSNIQIEDSIVYDMTVDHVNHRYWGGTGISSHNSGKSYLMARAIAEAQKNGYMVAVLDSEQAVSQDYLLKVGVNLDPSMLMTVQVQTVEQTQDMLLEVLESVKAEQQVLGNNNELKLMLIVDSIGMLSSKKSSENAAIGHHAADMGTKAKALTNMFNQIVQKVGITDTVCIITNHGALQVGVLFPQLLPKGGQCLTKGTEIQTINGLKNIEDIIVGDLVKTHLNQYKPVEKLFNFDDLDILEVELENGQIIKMTPEHKMLVLRNGEKQWLEVKYLTTDDSFLELIE